MNQRRRLTFALMLVGVFAFAAWFTLRLREPQYQGKKLSAWLRQLESAPDIASPAWQESVAAMRQMGPSALPSLMATIMATDPKWKIQAVDWLRDMVNVNLSDRLVGGRERQRALLGLQVLGPLARPAIPELAAMITNANPDLADVAFLALSGIGGQEIVPPLLHTLTNGSAILRPAAAVSLGAARSRAAEAVTALAEALTSSDGNLRANAARALGLIGRNPQHAVPALTRALGDKDSQVRSSAVIALGAFGTDAESALTTLQVLPVEQEEFPRRIVARSIVRVQCEMREGGIVRGPKREPRLALVFTGHEFAEGGEVILDELKRHRGKASFFLTGDFLRNPQFRPLVERMTGDGHYLGPHSDKHLLYCAWDEPGRTLVSREEFLLDLFANANLLPDSSGQQRRFNRYLLPAFEHYNGEIADWAREQRWSLINFTPGTHSNADYTGEADKNFIPSQAIFDSIVREERDAPNGLNGFILLLHLGSGPGRTDKFHARFGELLDALAGKGYQIVRVDELLGPKPEEFSRAGSAPTQTGPAQRPDWLPRP